MESLQPNTIAVLWGLGIGGVVGAAAMWSNFCAVGAVADIVFARDWRRMRAWMLAAGVALLGAQILDSLGVVHIGRALAPPVLWLPMLTGGICFGFGMTLAGGCVNRALVRLGAGSLKSLVTVIVVGCSAAASAAFWAPLRDALAQVGDFDILAAIPTFNIEIARWTFTVLLGGGLVVFCLKDSWFRASRDHLGAGLLIGAMIPAAWIATDGTSHLAALNFVTPLGDFLTTAITRHLPIAPFGIASIVGVSLGAFVFAAATRNLALETFTDRSDLFRHLIGGALMGVGGTLALGCTFGQGLSGLSTLSLNAMIAIVAIIFGSLWGIRYFETGNVWGGLKLTLRRGI